MRVNRIISIGLAAILALTMLLPAGSRALAVAGITWTVDRFGEGASDGDASAHTGSIRFVLEHAQPGDVVRIGEIGSDSLYITQTLAVPAGVSVGATRAEPCPAANRPLINLLALPALTSGPAVRLEAGATWRGVSIANASGNGGPKVAMHIAGADADVCGTAFSAAYDPEGASLEVAAIATALSIDGARALIHRNLIGGKIVVGVAGDDTLIGDSLAGSGEANAPLAGAFVSVAASADDAAQGVTVRDPIQRTLVGIGGAGLSGGDDLASHANHWALRPSIDSATSADGFASVTLYGSASPRSLVDIYYLYAGVLSHQSAVTADAGGTFSFSGPLPGSPVDVLAASTLNDPAFPGRAGSSSEMSGQYRVQAATAGEPQLAALGSVTNLSRPGSATAAPGDQIRLKVTLSSLGTGSVLNIGGTALQIAAAVQPIAGSGMISGGGGFSAGDAGFGGGTLAPGQTATYTLDATVLRTQLGTVIFTLDVGGTGVASIPVVGRMALVAAPAPAPSPSPGPAPALTPVIWLPQVQVGVGEQ